jgi:hypothetical protein
MTLSNRARPQSSRTAYIAYAGELLRLRQLAVLQYAAEVLLLRFRAVRDTGSNVLPYLHVSCEPRHIQEMVRQH